MTYKPVGPERAVLYDRQHRGQDAPPTVLYRSRYTTSTGVGVSKPSCMGRGRRPNGRTFRGQCLLRPCIVEAMQADNERKLPLVVELSTVSDQGTHAREFHN